MSGLALRAPVALATHTSPTPPNRAPAALGALALLALAWGPFVSEAPNRLAQAQGLSLWALLGRLQPSPGPWPTAVVVVLGLLGLLLLGLAWARAVRSTGAQRIAALALVMGLPPAALALAGRYAAQVAQSDTLVRVSVGWGLWCALACALLAGRALMTERAAASPGRSGVALRLWGPSLALLAVLLPLGGLVATGLLDSLSLLREHAQRADVFSEAIGQHLGLVGTTVTLALLLGVPLGVWGATRPAWGQAMGAVLGVVQTVPSVALYGLGMVPLGALAAASPLLASWGLAGVGTWPAVLALLLYALLPVVQGTLSGWQQVDAAVLEAARAMGLSPAQVRWRVRAPLALPVLLGGVRVMVVQVIGLAVVAALIGAGGFGALVFQGLYSSALDLVLLGVLPVVLMSLMADALLGALAQAAARGAS